MYTLRRNRLNTGYPYLKVSTKVRGKKNVYLDIDEIDETEEFAHSNN